MHAHNHITQAVAAIDRWFALIEAHPPGIAVGSISGGLLALVGNCKTVLPRHAYGDDITEKN